MRVREGGAAFAQEETRTLRGRPHRLWEEGIPERTVRA